MLRRWEGPAQQARREGGRSRFKAVPPHLEIGYLAHRGLGVRSRAHQGRVKDSGLALIHARAGAPGQEERGPLEARLEATVQDQHAEGLSAIANGHMG